jgi:hypothetical protein
MCRSSQKGKRHGTDTQQPGRGTTTVRTIAVDLMEYHGHQAAPSLSLRAYVQTSLDLPSPDLRRLEFVRWLVLTGKLTDWQ